MNEIPVIKFIQANHTLLFFSIPAIKLRDMVYYKHRNVSKEGVQRDLNLLKCKEIAEYINNEEGIIPNNIIVNIELDKYGLSLDDILVENMLDLRKLTNSSITIDSEINEPQPIFVIDGQHRLKSFDFIYDKDFVINVTALVNLDISEVAEIFVKINYYQKPINKSHTYDLLGLNPGLFPNFYPIHVAIEKLNNDLDSPLYNNIKMLGVGKGIITQASIITAIDKYKIRIAINNFIGKVDVESIYNVIWMFFTAIKMKFPIEWDNRNTIMTKSIGMRALIKSIKNILERCTTDNTEYNMDIVSGYLNKLPEGFWNDKTALGLGGERGVNELYNSIITSFGLV